MAMMETCPPPYRQSDTTRWQPPTSTHYQDSRPFSSNSSDHHNDQPVSSSANSRDNERSSLDFTQRIERKVAEFNASHNVFKRWLFEILSWLVSASCMGAIIGIYIWLKEKPMSQTGELLTYTNILGKVASAALIVPTSEALGQLKWNWFHDSKAMWDFEIFDKASRCVNSEL